MSRHSQRFWLVVVACATCAVAGVHALGGPRVQDVTPFANVRYEDMAYSPDGQSLAFLVPLTEGGDPPADGVAGGVYVMGRNGRPTRLLSPAHDHDARLYGPILWSRDGRRIMLPGHGWGSKPVLVIDMDTGEATRIPLTPRSGLVWMWNPLSDHGIRLTPTEAYQRFVVGRFDTGISRRGSRFAVDEGWVVQGERGTPEHQALWVIDPNGEVATLVMDKPEFAWIKLSPRQTRALVADNQDGLHVVGGDGRGLARVVEGAPGVAQGVAVAYPQWAPDDSAVAYRTLVDPSDVDGSAHRLWVVDFAAVADDK